METLTALIKFASIKAVLVSFGLKSKRDNDFVDRLSSRYTVCMLVVFSIIITIDMGVGAPIHCWAPKHFTNKQRDYANSFCWVKNTYYLPFHEEIPEAHETR